MPDGFNHILDGNLAGLSAITPELLVGLTFLVALIWDVTRRPEQHRSTAYLCLGGLLAALWFNWQQNDYFVRTLADVATPVSRELFSGMIVFDHFGTLFKLILLVGTLISVLLAVYARELEGRNHGEFYLLLVAVCLGGMFLVSATNLLMIYLGLESLSVVSYALAGYLRRDRKSAEAGIKYVVYGAMASGLMLYGLSFLYGLTGTLELLGPQGVAARITAQAQSAQPQPGLVVVLLLVLSGFLYKIAAVPFHYWAPDVYEGAPTTATGFFSVVPKAAGFAVLIRVLCAFFPPGPAASGWFSQPQAEGLLAVLAVLTMTIGNLAALGQTNAKRLLAYSSIAQAGYMLAGLSVLKDTTSLAAVLYYLIVYLFMNLGAFLVLVALENRCGGSDLRQLRGAIRSERVLCVALCLFLFSLTGLPPLGGFMGKYLIMVALAGQQHWALIVCIGLNSVVSLYYYMKLAKAVIIDVPDHELPPLGSNPFTYRALAVVHSAVLVGLFVYVEPVQRLCVKALAALGQ